MTDEELLQSGHPGGIASMLGCGVSAPLVSWIAQSPRFRARMAGVVAARLNEVGSVSREQAKVLAMQPDELIDLANRAGSVWHAGSIVRIIDGPSRRLLVELLGETNHASALANAGLQPPGLAVDRRSEEIAKAVPVDGVACLAAWCEAQPMAVSTRLRLIRPAASPEHIHATWGPPIIARLLAD
jgi:hypothetical protein